ncbi:hypothetical protein CWB41_13995 [Methylovirgula ligni]|uniref:Uncharacterized protein n=1 Tax=Methylovirgula ligni TaxID=569860 RepID=A0A3D9YL41_9HYPH|nr:hypothetical protein [Methylovirgula ligni]QAY96705.1 hypothetical protein CWB41_13995 [Methylovirgula ligni]REF83254.1 hypothetical protein DES32_3170 [Methylovirgula ligni]
MTGVNPSAEAAYRRAIEKAGVSVTFKRVSGAAPNTVSFSADVTAIVRDYTDDGGAGQRDGLGPSVIGGITQGKRQIIVMAADLKAKRFPLPVVKSDQIYVSGSDALLTVDSADAQLRAMAGAIDIAATGAP